jgi:hypothetical protein
MSTATADIQAESFTVSSGFIGNFKLGDNINHTLDALSLLYETQRAGESPSLLCKPIIILVGSICEAVLYDLLCVRIKHHTVEGVKNIAKDVVNRIRGSHIDEFGKYIASVRKHDLLKDVELYESLDELRKLRNRIHIQNTKAHFDPDDGKTFTSARQREAEKTLEKVIKTMARDYPRKGHCQGYVGDFRLPWKAHFPSF